ncbi:hypothetical protein AK830_g11323 [Neonectria ditissima]|uniref:Heterokaryon incompatibility domain-containing protein n=1 Tax=Neonectria ditissima TaxID=78410 RepID=A0A0P7ADA1_9HYPO|nr:hypothetical protein AK830_g11323 [Neonectria ditissima]
MAKSPPSDVIEVSATDSTMSDVLEKPPLPPRPEHPLDSKTNTWLSKITHGRGDTEKVTDTQQIRRRPLLRTLKLWVRELLSLLLSLVSFLAIIILLRAYKDTTLSSWKLPISINAVVAILSALFRGGLAAPITEGMSQLKWIWFSQRPQSLADMEQYDQVSRGGLVASFLMIARQFVRRHRSYLAGLGAFIFLATLAADPFSQASLDSYSCLRPTRGPASIPKANHYTAFGTHVFALENAIDGPMQLAIYLGVLDPPVNSSTSVSTSCGTGNCTFPSDEGATFSTLTMCSECRDISHTVKPFDEGWNYKLPSNTSLTPSILFNTSYGSDIEWDSPPMSSFTGLTMKNTDPECVTSSNSCDMKPFAFSCAIIPCAKTYAANFTKSRYHEKEVTREYLNFVPTDEHFALGVNRTIHNGRWKDCNATERETKTNSVQVFGSEVLSLKKGDSTDGVASMWYSPECAYTLGAISNTVIGGFIGSFFDEESLQMASGPSTNTGSVWLQSLWANGRINMTGVEAYAEGIATSVGAQMRKNPSEPNSTWTVTGQAFNVETCVEVRWRFLSYLAALLALELLFFGAVMVVNYTTPWDGDWKSSSLAPLVHGLDSGRNLATEGAPLADTKTMLAAAKPIKKADGEFQPLRGVLWGLLENYLYEEYFAQRKSNPGSASLHVQQGLHVYKACGCRICRTVIDVTPRMRAVWQDRSRDTWSDDEVITVRSIPDGLEIRSGVSSVPLFTKSKCDLDIPRSSLFWFHTGDEFSMVIAREWLNDCITNHPACSASKAQDPRLPARVLDLQPIQGGDVCLKVTNMDRGSYACLSHCWGGHQPLKTTKHTLAQYQRGINWTALPQTFRDAIKVARELSIRYIWIDSLCIVQDDDLDWQQQSALMAEIYRFATITIAASASSGPDEGLFTGNKGSIASNDPRREGYEVRMPTLHHARSSLPLLKRGWVFQERLLSPRMLHFARGELMWECWESIHCGCTQGIRQHLILPRGHPHRLESWIHSKRAIQNLDTKTPLEVANAWREIVNEYVALQLTYPKDTFPALSGLAKSMPATAGKYIAGLWENWFLDDLWWSSPNVVREQDSWRAPSFSWASNIFESMTATAWHHSESRRRIYQLEAPPVNDILTITYTMLLESHCVPEGVDPTGRLLSAHVMLSGPLLSNTVFHSVASLINPSQVRRAEEVWYLKLKARRGSGQELRLLVLRKVGIEAGCHGVFQRAGIELLRSDKREPHVDEWFDKDQVVEDAIIKLI